MLSFKQGIFFILFTAFAFSALAQLGMGGGMGSRDTSSKKFKISAFPYINYNRTQKFMYGAVGMGMFRLNQEDTISPKSMVGLMAIGTTTNTWGTMGFSTLYFNEDKWRATLYGGYFSFNFQFYWSPVANLGTFVQYNTGYTMASGKIMRRITKVDNDNKLYAGIHGTYAEAKTTFSLVDTSVKANPTNLNNIGLDINFDSRNDVYYPESGFFIDGSWDWNPSWLGNRKSFNKINLAINNYHRIHKRIIQASRFYTSFGVGNVPFEGQQIIGRTDIRGYSEGKQRGDQLFALQTESRIQIYKRISCVVFVGIATVTSDISDVSVSNLWPSAGAGMRYVVMKEEHFNIGLDIAAGRDDWTLSFTIGETF